VTWTARQLIGGGRVDPVGEASYQAALEQIAGGKHHESAALDVTAVLIPEPDNPYDPNAVCVRVDNECVAYLCRADAITYQPDLLDLWRREVYCWCRATIIGGWLRDDGDEGNFGIWLDLAAPELAFGEQQSTQAPMSVTLTLTPQGGGLSAVVPWLNLLGPLSKDLVEAYEAVQRRVQVGDDAAIRSAIAVHSVAAARLRSELMNTSDLPEVIRNGAGLFASMLAAVEATAQRVGNAGSDDEDAATQAWKVAVDRLDTGASALSASIELAASEN
jgi:hypothetical protein